jgi:hypothetical protein
LGNLRKYGFLGREILCGVLIFLLLGMAGAGVALGEGPRFDQEQELRAEEMERALEKAANPKQAETVSKEKKETFFSESDKSKKSKHVGVATEHSEKGDALGEKETLRPVQEPKKQERASSAKKDVLEDPSEESSPEYSALENVTWESSKKKVTMQLWVSGQATPVIHMIRDQDGMKMRLIPKGLATRMRRAVSAVPSGVQSFSIQEDLKLTKEWKLEAPYYAVGEIQTAFAFPVQYSVRQEPGLLEISFLFSKKAEPKEIKPVSKPAEKIEILQREVLGRPEITLGTSYQAQIQLADNILYGVQKPPSIADLYKKERESAEFIAQSGLPENVRPLLESSHPPFGSADYFKKYVHGSIGQTFNFASNYNDGTTSAFQQNRENAGEPGSGKNIGTILWTPAIAMLFYRPGAVDVSAGYSASRDFPTTHNNFMYGLNRQDINFGVAHYPQKRYAFAMRNNLGITGGTTRQKMGSKWVKDSAGSEKTYTFNNNFGLNYRLSKRLIWGGGAGLTPQWSETKTTGVRDQTFTGGLNTYLGYRATPRMELLLGTAFDHVFKDTGEDDCPEASGSVPCKVTKGNSLPSVFLKANYRYSKKLTFTGGLQGTLIDWDLGKIGGSVRVTYQRTPLDDFSFQFADSVVQDNTSMILSRLVNTSGGRGITLQRFVTMGLRYNRQFDHGKTRGALEVRYMKTGPLSGVYYGTSSDGNTTNYDLRFTASVRRAVLRNRAWLGLLYSYEYAPERVRDNVTGQHDFTSNTAQNILVTMDYAF